MQYTLVMKILPEPIVFEWDKGNIDKSVNKHKVSNKEAEEVFENEPIIIIEDVKHSDQEERFVALGKTNKERLLFLSFTVRKDRIRIISSRDMDRKEERQYEEV